MRWSWISKSLLDLTLERARALAGVEDCLAVTAEDYRFMVSEALDRAGLAGDGAARTDGAQYRAGDLCGGAEDMAEDPTPVAGDPAVGSLCAGRGRFGRAISKAVALAGQGWWVTLGIRPDEPSSAYGYIEPGRRLDGNGARQVARFIEKPDPETAVELIDGGCLWNAGIFVVQAQMAADLDSKSMRRSSMRRSRGRAGDVAGPAVPAAGIEVVRGEPVDLDRLRGAGEGTARGDDPLRGQLV